jgi:hypothetical protein
MGYCSGVQRLLGGEKVLRLVFLVAKLLVSPLP